MNSFLYSVYFHQAIGSKDHLQNSRNYGDRKLELTVSNKIIFFKYSTGQNLKKDTHQKQRKSGELSKRINVQVDWHSSNAAILKYIDAYCSKSYARVHITIAV